MISERLFSSAMSVALFGGSLLASSAAYAVPTVFEHTITPDDFRASWYADIDGVWQDHPDSWGGGSWQAAGNGISKFLVMPVDVFGYHIRLNQIESVSYWTKKEGGAGDADWAFQMYVGNNTTVRDDYYFGTTGWWIFQFPNFETGTMFKAEPYWALNKDAPAGEWNYWSSDGSQNQLTFSPDNNQGGLLSSIQNSHGNNWVYALGVHTGNPWADSFTGQVDGLTITLTNGDIAKLNFEPSGEAPPPDVAPIPEPVTGLLTLIGLGGLGVAGLRRRR